MNMLRGTAKRNGNGFALESPDGLNFRLPPDVEVTDGQPIILGVRPEHLSICEGGLPCKIEHTETLGREILLYGSCGRAPVCIAPGNRPAVQAGDTIGLRYELDHACVFDSVSERNLVHGN
jgi:multiple sugar transport system ATP-binding protein